MKQESQHTTPQIGNSTNMKTRARKCLDPVVCKIKEEIQEITLKNVKKRGKHEKNILDNNIVTFQIN